MDERPGNTAALGPMEVLLSKPNVRYDYNRTAAYQNARLA